MCMVPGSRPVLVVVAALCSCSGPLEYPTKKSCVIYEVDYLSLKGINIQCI